MPDAALVAKIKKEFLALGTDGRGRRDWAVKKAIALGRGGSSAVHEATGIALSTIRRGIKNLKSGNSLPEGRQRRPGAGRRAAVEHDPRLLLSTRRRLCGVLYSPVSSVFGSILLKAKTRALEGSNPFFANSQGALSRSLMHENSLPRLPKSVASPRLGG